MSIIDDINFNTSAVSNAKLSLQKTINAKGGNVPVTGNFPTFRELIDGVGNIVGVDGGNGTILNITATSPITKGSPVEIKQNVSSSLSMLGVQLPTTARIGSTSVSRFDDYEYVPYVSRSGRFLALWFTYNSTYVLIPFYKVNNAWVQMKVGGAYASAYTLSSEVSIDGLASYDELTYPRLAALGNNLYSVDTTELNLTRLASFSTTNTLVSVYLFKNHIFANEKRSMSKYLVLYKYDSTANTITNVTSYSGAFDDATTNGTDVFVAIGSSAVIMKFVLTNGTFTRSKSLSIPHDNNLQGMCISAGCTTVAYCEGNTDDGYKFRQHLIDPDTLTYTEQDLPVKFSSSPRY